MIEPKHVQPVMVFSSMNRRLYLYELKEGEGLMIHKHPYSHEILVTAGEVTVILGSVEKTLGPGGVFRFPDGGEHGVIARKLSGIITVFDETTMTEEDRKLGGFP